MAGSFEKAKDFVIPWGDHKGKRIDEVARSDRGLHDLDRLLAWMEGKNHRSNFRAALEVYLGDDSIKRELESSSS